MKYAAYRRKLFFESDRIDFFKNICLEIGRRYWFEFDTLGTDGDHVHVFVGAASRSEIWKSFRSLI